MVTDSVRSCSDSRVGMMTQVTLGHSLIFLDLGTGQHQRGGTVRLKQTQHVTNITRHTDY